MYNLREIAENFKAVGKFKGQVLFDEPVAIRTTFKIGGTAPLLVEPEDTDSLLAAITNFSAQHVPVFILGGGSNIVVSDEGFEGAVIATCAIQFIRPFYEAGGPLPGQTVRISCGAGMSMQQLVSYCTAHALSGAESFSGLPGSVGGAVYMNARCFNVSVSDILRSVEYIDPESGLSTYNFESDDWDYKKSPFTGTGRIITSAEFHLVQRPENEKIMMEEKCAGIRSWRVEKGHFRFPSAGSVFKNNRTFGVPSGKLVAEAGLCGFRVGGAQVAPWHGNFIINTNHATQSDVRKLVQHIIAEVKKRSGLLLEPEIIFCGKQKVSD